MSAETEGPEEIGTHRSTRSSMLFLPHTPQAEVVNVPRLEADTRSMSKVVPGDGITSIVLAYSSVPGRPQWEIRDTSLMLDMIPSESRKPAVSHSSCPGVRIVTATGSPATRISNGSSIANVSVVTVPDCPSYRVTGSDVAVSVTIPASIRSVVMDGHDTYRAYLQLSGIGDGVVSGTGEDIHGDIVEAEAGKHGAPWGSIG